MATGKAVIKLSSCKGLRFVKSSTLNRKMPVDTKVNKVTPTIKKFA